MAQSGAMLCDRSLTRRVRLWISDKQMIRWSVPEIPRGNSAEHHVDDELARRIQQLNDAVTNDTTLRSRLAKHLAQP